MSKQKNSRRRSLLVPVCHRSVKPGITLLASLCLILFLLVPQCVRGEERYFNPNNLRTVDIDDRADLLTAEEEEQLVEAMKPITEYGEVSFHTVSSHSGSFTSYAESYYYDKWGNDSGVMLIIDMQERELTILSAGSVYSVVTDGKARSITDNIYRYAQNGNYYGCAAEAYREVDQLLRGHAIAEPMRYITSALLAILIALLFNFMRVRNSARINAASVDSVAATAGVDIRYTPVDVRLLNETRTYSPLPKAGAGGGGGGRPGGGGFSGGGGGFSGGGGSHKF